MTMGLDIKELIEVAESVIYDDQVGLAASISKPVQLVYDDEGNPYRLSITLEKLPSV